MVYQTIVEIPGGKIRFFCEVLYHQKWSPGLNTLITDETFKQTNEQIYTR